MKAWALAALFWFIAAPVGCHLYLNKPWYDGELANRLNQRPGPFAGPVDVTEIVADLFPAGMAKSAGIELLRSNGFDCGNPLTNENSALVCDRTHSRIPCADRWTVKLVTDENEIINGREARAWANCL